MTFRILPKAEDDLREIAFYIALDSGRAAQRWLDDIEERFANLALMPGMGVMRADIRPDLRLLPAGRYLVLYRQVGEDVEIVRVLHGARQWQDLID